MRVAAVGLGRRHGRSQVLGEVVAEGRVVRHQHVVDAGHGSRLVPDARAALARDEDGHRVAQLHRCRHDAQGRRVQRRVVVLGNDLMNGGRRGSVCGGGEVRKNTIFRLGRDGVSRAVAKG